MKFYRLEKESLNLGITLNDCKLQHKSGLPGTERLSVASPAGCLFYQLFSAADYRNGFSIIGNFFPIEFAFPIAGPGVEKHQVALGHSQSVEVTVQLFLGFFKGLGAAEDF